MKTTHGFTILELVVVTAVAGILLGIAIVALPQDRFAVNQAAQIVAAQITRTRFEAIKGNDAALMQVLTTGAGGLRVCVDSDDDATCDSGEVIEEVLFGTGELARVEVASVTLTGGADSLVFDRRGVPNPIRSGTIILSNRGGTYTKQLDVSASGRVDIQ